MQDVTELPEQHRVDRQLPATPLRINPELSLIATFSLLFGLPRTMSRAFVELVKYDLVTRSVLHAALSDGDPVSKSNIVDVTIYRLRKSLAPHGIEIVTLCKQGYRLTSGSLDKIGKLLAAYDAGVADVAPPPPGNTPSRPRRAKPEAA